MVGLLHHKLCGGYQDLATAHSRYMAIDYCSEARPLLRSEDRSALFIEKRV